MYVHTSFGIYVINGGYRALQLTDEGVYQPARSRA